MKIDGFRTLSGPNRFHRRPVLVLTLDLEELEFRPSSRLGDFMDRLVALLPGLQDHVCSRGRPGGFVERLREGTYLGHIVEHIALELSSDAGIPVTFGKTISTARKGIYEVAVRFTNEEGMRYLLRSSVDLALALMHGRDFALGPCIDEARRIVARTALGPSTQAIVDAAVARGIPWRRLNDENLIQFGYGKNKRLIQATTTQNTSCIAADIVQDKRLTKALLAQAFVPVSDAAAGNLRVLVVGGKVAGAAERIPAHVTGNGNHTVRELIEHENENPLRGDGHEKPMTALPVDETTLNHLRRQHISLEDIAEAGRKIWLRDVGTLSTGGSTRDVTNQLHPETRAICERAARTLGLDVCGLDWFVRDPSRALAQQQGGITEVCASPDLRMHPGAGSAIIESLYPPGCTGRIPIVAVTGTNGKTTTTRLLSAILELEEHVLGVATSDEIRIGGETLARGELNTSGAGRSILADSSVEVAALEIAHESILREGLPFESCDVAVMTNLHRDHLIEGDGLEDLLHEKSVVLESVREGGTVILNADDALLTDFADSPRLAGREKVLFTRDWKNPKVLEHLRRGGLAYVLRENGAIFELTEDTEKLIGKVQELPITLGGQAEFQIENLMAAVAAARALGVSIENVRHALLKFEPMDDNPGRLDLHRLGAGYVILDRATNAAALQAVSSYLRQLERPLTGVIGVPADRSDELIRDVARAATGIFDRFIVRDSRATPLRESGDVLRILEDEIRGAGTELPIASEADEGFALNRAIAEMRPGEVVVFLVDRPNLARDLLEEFGATRVRSIPAERPRSGRLDEDHFDLLSGLYREVRQ